MFSSLFIQATKFYKNNLEKVTSKEESVFSELKHARAGGLMLSGLASMITILSLVVSQLELLALSGSGQKGN